ncbi:MAG: glycoside hydrolase family 92 protein [Ruminococcaceae bacterium]|nr:glycoside hydrolase family 92 protein [Oscillospiraceae bacterium]
MDYLKYVNIKQGTKSLKRFSKGNTLPLVQRPFGFAAFAPQTESNRGTWFYHPEDRSFEGVRLTHQPSPWIWDHGAIVIQPQSEEPYLEADSRWSGFEPEKTVLMPHYMRYYLTRPKAAFELTPTVYGAWARVNYESDFDCYLSVLPVDGGYGYKYDSEKGRLYCCTDCNELKGYDKGTAITYFVFEFEKDAVNAEKTLVEDGSGKKPGTAIEGEKTGIHLCLNKKNITFRLASSYISYEQAEINLENDSKYEDFDALKKENEKIWNSYLSRIKIKADEDTMKTFYSCMYRVFLYPHKAYEIDKNGNAVHYSPSADEVKNGVRYTDNGFWDTYRTVYPLYSIIAKEEYKEILEGFIADYVDGGWLPCWTAMDAKKCMPSTMIDAVIADAAVKGIISGELLKTAFSGMEKHASTPSENPAYGREGCGYYTQIGYVPSDKHRESVNLTLDAAYCDYCLGVVAEILGEKEKSEKYFNRAKNYKNIFDKETGFMRGKRLDESFEPDFDPIKWGKDYTEAAAWQTTFAVQHDLDGLAELYGGRQGLLNKLDEFFNTPPAYRVGGYKVEIHEMTEFMAGAWGQCAISNQPSFHIPFIYAYLGETEKTNYWVKKICSEGFSWKDDGFPGDEDNGTTAAWYIFAVLGMYPICPGKNEYIKFHALAEEIEFEGGDRDGY